MKAFRLLGFALAVSIIIYAGYQRFVDWQIRKENPYTFMEITSPSFAHNGIIPEKFTCDGEDVNPELRINNVPAGTKSLALIVDDRDAIGGWVHWTVWNIDPSIVSIEPNSVPAGARTGETSFGKTGYGGPCPHSGIHRYHFRLYALDRQLELPAGSSIGQLQSAIGTPIAESVIVGKYGRAK